ncbi:DinB family protein [Brumimicrobium glaciale]|uniref:DinB family protein n=1 Tax=Brumimicrobium glaciale TaxID=200475 RepID=A0A4Q4KG71_9FLAO|nr:DinB family protein [Brumimicrobium glaciale]RYM32131.1 DinB family protein [Brumimicrobium glaciale]
MKGFLTDDLLLNLRNITELNIALVSKKCTHLGENQIKWKPSKDSWNIQEVLSHLNSYSTYYHHVFIDKIQNTKFSSVKENFVPSPLGRSAWRSMKLGRLNNIKRKFRAPKNLNPSISPELIDLEPVTNFVKNQQELIIILEDAERVNLKKVKIPISISKMVRLRLGDALMFVIYHNERHIQQVKNILAHPNFPKKQ